MATLTVSDQKIAVPRKLKRAFDAAEMGGASLVAQVADGARRASCLPGSRHSCPSPVFGNKTGVIWISAAVVSLLGIPLFCLGIKLTVAKSRWTWLGVAGILLGLAGTLVLVFAVLAAIALR